LDLHDKRFESVTRTGCIINDEENIEEWVAGPFHNRFLSGYAAGLPTVIDYLRGGIFPLSDIHVVTSSISFPLAVMRRMIPLNDFRLSADSGDRGKYH
jgi:hypothetical protein